MKLIIDVDEKLVCEGFERTLTEEERNILIRAIGNGVKPKKGEWIECNGFCECSECQHREDNDRFIWNDMNFCSTCGAAMRG